MKHFLLICTLLFSLQSSGQGSLEGDRLALVALYNAMGGPDWFVSSGWTVAGPVGSSPCGWYGVTCENGRVTGLDLSQSGLNGIIPPEIGNLDQLKSLTLGWTPLARENPIYGPIPTEIGNLINLEHLDLSGRTGWGDDWKGGAMPVRGPIPPSLGNLTKLTYLDLSYLPQDVGFDPFGFISGSIPPELGNLVNLTYLNISSQSLTGNLPTELGQLTKLQTLLLAENDFSGEIPSSINNLSQLQLLDLHYQSHQRSHQFGLLHGEVPNLSGVPLSAKINLSGNSFTFAGMEQNVGHQLFYGYQASIPIQTQNGKLSVEAGGTMANNTYKWFKRGPAQWWGAPAVLLATIVGNKYYEPAEPGIYLVEVTNSVATQLTLQSSDYSLTSMPVTLAAFRAVNNYEGNLLTWETASEANNFGFEIEKSADTRNFEKIGFVDGSGDSKENKVYRFTDPAPLQTSYYRLKQIDYDGKFEYSRIVSVKLGNAMFSVYPNPAQNQIFLKGLDKKEEVTIRNPEGVVMLRENVLPKQPINVNNWSSGVYTVTVGNDTKKIVILD